MINKILEKISSYNKNSDIELIKKAYNFCTEAHINQKRKSGEPYSNHVINVGFELAKLKMDDESIIAGFLHDIIEDTKYDKEYISKEFSPKIAELVDGVTKLEIKANIENVKQVENLRKIFFAMSKDIRVLLIKICDRLDNMRTIGFHGNEGKIRKIAIETLEIYAPLCERIGLYKISTELQDICFDCINHNAREFIKNNINDIKNKHEKDILSQIISKLEILLYEYGVKAEIIGREKTPYSIWKKIKNKNIKINDLTDILAFRIITKTEADCYKVLGILHTSYRCVNEKFYDYVSVPKLNGYKSIHTCINDERGNKIEVQIRDVKMHEDATFGMASHWIYKQNKEKDSIQKEYQKFINNILRIFDSSNNVNEILELAKTEISFDRIFILTPKSDLIDLPYGASVLDFAFSLHTEIGSKTLYAFVNSVKQDIDFKLNSGDTVEIIVSDSSIAAVDWLSMCITSKAKTAIKKLTTNSLASEYKKKSLNIFNKVCESFGKRGVDFESLIFSLQKKYNKSKDVIIESIALFKIDLIKEIDLIECVNVTEKDFIEKKPSSFIVKACQCCKPDLNKDKYVVIIVPNHFMLAHKRDCKFLHSSDKNLKLLTP